jgi:hypothetical protein
VKPELDTNPADFVAPSSLLEKKINRVYDAHRMAGLPIGVQIVGLRFRDETVLRAMRELEQALGGNAAVSARVQCSFDVDDVKQQSVQKKDA